MNLLVFINKLRQQHHQWVGEHGVTCKLQLNNAMSTIANKHDLSLFLSLTCQHFQLPNARRHCVNKCKKEHSALAQQRTQRNIIPKEAHLNMKDFDLTSSLIQSLFHTFIHLFVQLLTHPFDYSLADRFHSFIPNQGASCHALDTIGNRSMRRGALGSFRNVSTYGTEVIKY